MLFQQSDAVLAATTLAQVTSSILKDNTSYFKRKKQFYKSLSLSVLVVDFVTFGQVT